MQPDRPGGRTAATTLDKYQTKATPVTDDEARGLSYDKMATVIERHRETVDEKKIAKALHALAPVSQTTQTLTITLPTRWTGEEVHIYWYLQRLADSSQQTLYQSYFNGGQVAAEAVRRSVANIEAAAEYSASVYAGCGRVG